MTTTQTAKQRILARAEADYQPGLVAVDEQAIARMPARAERFGELPVGLSGLAAGQTRESAAAYSIVLNSLNFMFWSLTPDGIERYHWQGEGGANGIKAALDQAWGAEPSPARLRAQLGSGTEQVVTDALGDISVPRRRGQFLREVLGGDRLEHAAAALVEAAQSGLLTSDDAQLLANRFPIAYGQDPYLVRAQLAVMWYAGFLREQGVAVDCDITVAAGYQMPRVMRSIKVLRFAPELAAKIDGQSLLLRESAEERAIRAATVLGTQMMALHVGVSEHAMVNVLWQNRHACGAIPYHLTVTTDY
jgi:hypothetical protein